MILKTTTFLGIFAVAVLNVFAQLSSQRQAQPSATHVSIESNAPKQTHNMHAMLYVSTQDPSMDWWFRIPSDSGPHISEIRRAFIGQDFWVYPFVERVSNKDGKFSVRYEVNVKTPKGEVRRVVNSENFSGQLQDTNAILACPDIVCANFDSSYEKGKYIFTIKATDLNSGKTAESSSYVELCDWNFPNPLTDENIVNDSLKSFYMQPNPELLYSIFYSKYLNLEQSDAPNKLNYTTVGFLRTAFAKNKFLLPIIREKFSKMENLDRIKTIFLFAILGEPRFPKDDLSEKEWNYQIRIRDAELPDPYAEWHPILGAVQMDMLWGEFYADGTYRPVRRVIDALSLTEEAKFIDNYGKNKKRPASIEEKRKFMLGILYKAALISLAKRSEENALIKKYCIWAMENNDFPQGAKESKEALEIKK